MKSVVLACVAACSSGGDSPPSATPPPSRSGLRIAPPIVTGALDKHTVRSVVQRAAPALEACAKPGAAGTLDARFVIAGTGKVSTVEAHGVDPDVASCVERVLRAIEFPKPPDGLAVQVTQQLAFKSLLQ